MASTVAEVDYVIVGAGSAGCVLAARLSEDPSVSVCLIEAGGSDNGKVIRIPAAVAAIIATPFKNWAYKTVPQPHLGNRRGFQPRGRVLGGSSSINAMIYIRGQREDYADWVKAGAAGWGWEDVRPYFLKAQNQERGADDHHAVGGPLNVADLRHKAKVADAFIEAGEQLQIPRNDDFNADSQEGVGWYQVTQKDGQRWSAARAYLTPALSRPNLTVITKARATKVLMEGKRAVGLAYRKGGDQEVRARREVILSGGAFNSPQLLMLSGIGPGHHLKAQGIDVVHDLPGVGRNLQDHIDYVAAYHCKTRDALGLGPGGLLEFLRAYGPWKRDGQGLLTTNFAEAGGFLKTDPALKRPDIQLHFVIGIVDDHTRKRHFKRGYSCHVCVLRPKSRGTVTLQSADPKKAPLIDPKFLSDPADLATLVEGYKAMRRILEAPAFAPYRGRELYTNGSESDAEIEAWIRRRADTVYHPVGTCRMGTDTAAVVDPALKVRGLDGLRVVDASVMPTVISGNTNAPCIMIGEKAADLIRAAA